MSDFQRAAHMTIEDRKTTVPVTSKPYYDGNAEYVAEVVVGDPGGYRQILGATMVAREGLTLDATLSETATYYVLSITDPEGTTWATSMAVKQFVPMPADGQPSDEDVNALVEVMCGIEDHESIAREILRAGYQPPEVEPAEWDDWN